MKKIYDLNNLSSFPIETDFIIIERFPEINYVLLKRNYPCDPWIAAWEYNEYEKVWRQGHYFSTMIDAMRFIDNKLREVSYDRMSEIASRLLDYVKDESMFGNDFEEILSNYDIELSDKEKEYFCIEEHFFSNEEE